MPLPARPMPRVTAQVEPYVKALGPDLAVTFLLHYGGAELNIRTRPNAETEYVELIGVDGARALIAHADKMPRRVPLVKAWLTAMLDWQGHTVPEIARKLRVSIERALSASRAARACLDEMNTALEEALETTFEQGVYSALQDAAPPDPHRREHRPGRRAKLAAAPELRAFVEARFGTMTFDEIADAVADCFPPERRVRRSAIHDWWKRHHKPSRSNRL